MKNKNMRLSIFVVMAIAGSCFSLAQAADQYQSHPVSRSGVKSRVKTQDSAVYYVRGRSPCWEAAGAYHNVDPWLLYSIASVETEFNPRAINKNANGTFDVGMMQINSSWFPVLRAHGILPSVLLDPCASTYVGAWIVSKNIKRYGYSWRAVGAYNTKNPVGSLKYARKVYYAYRKLTRLYALSHKPK